MKRTLLIIELFIFTAMVLILSNRLLANTDEDTSRIVVKHIVIDHQNKIIYKCPTHLLNQKIVVQRNLKAKTTWDMKRQQEYNIYLINYNPFRYEYAWKGVTKTKIVDVSPVQQFIDSLLSMQKLEDENVQKNFLDTFEPNTKGDDTHRITLNKDDMKNYIKNVNQLRRYGKKINKHIDNWDREKLVKVLDEWSDDIAKQIKEFYKEVTSDQMKYINYYNQNKEAPKNMQNYYVYLAFIQDQKESVLALLRKLESINSVVRTLKKNKLILGTVTFTPDNILTANIEIKKIGKNLSESEDYVGPIKLVFEPYKKFHYIFGIAQVWSTFKTTDEETGKESDLKLQVPILTISPTTWWKEDNDVKLGLQLGLTINDNIYHALIGPAIFLKNWLLFGGGLHYRSGGEVDKHFGAYFNVGINFAGNSKK